MFFSLLVLVAIMYTGLRIVLAILNDDPRPTNKQLKYKSLEKENAELKEQISQLNTELTAYRLQLPWWREEQDTTNGTQE